MEADQLQTKEAASEAALERELVALAKTDEAAFEKLYALYFPKIYGFVLRRTGSKEEAEDIVSVTFIKVFTKLGQYEYQNCSFSAWIYTVASNCLVDHYRKNGRRSEKAMDELPDVVDEAQNPEIDAVKSEEKQKVQRVLATLPTKYQKILQLKFFAEFNNSEIAEALGVSANNAGVLIHRALASFEKAYQQYV